MVSFVGGVPLGRFPEVATVRTLDPTHGVHGGIETLAVATQPAVLALPVGCDIGDEEGSFRPTVALRPRHVDGLALRGRHGIHTEQVRE